MTEPIWVGMRLRPFVDRERGQAPCLRIEDNQVYVVEDAVDSERRLDMHKSLFAFDVAMDSTDRSSPNYVSQEKCYEIMGARMLQHTLQGFNTCLFCYGQTGTGKTTTIMGSASPPSERGLLMRLVDDIFEEVEKRTSGQTHLVMQMLEVYNEKLNDLLASDTPHEVKKKINIHVHPELGVYLTGATEVPVKTAEECIKTIEYGNTMKVVHATAMNAQSSRGHTVFKLNMVKQGGNDNMTTNAEVCFADLAGRENEKLTQVTGDRLTELGFINKSLLYLSNCIQSLGQPERKRRQTVAALEVPGTSTPRSKNMDMSKFRNSKLTLLLSNALSGNSRTSMIGTLSPAAANFEESHNTLRFASTVKTIKVRAKAAQAVDKDALVRNLQREIQDLKKELEQAREKHNVEDISALQDKLEANSAIMAVQTRDWTSFQKESVEESRKRARTMETLMLHSSSQQNAAFPYLANYSEDPHLAFKLVMQVPADGEEKSLGSGDGCYFTLPPGLGVSEVMGFIQNDGHLYLRAAVKNSLASRACSIEVNGVKLDLERIELHHLDCVLFGRSTTFYVFLQPATPEELSAKLQNHDLEKDWDGQITAQQLEEILGKDRVQDKVDAELARVYCNQLQSHNRNSEGTLLLKAFLHRATRARKMVDDANHITADLRPESGLFFELAAQAPVLACGFSQSNIPELCVLLLRYQVLRPLQRFQQAGWRVIQQQRQNRGCMQEVVKSVVEMTRTGGRELLCSLTLPKFLYRLELMHEVRLNWGPSVEGDPPDKWRDPWAEYDLPELEQLREEHQLQMKRAHQEFQERLRQRETERDKANLELQRLRQELESARQQLRQSSKMEEQPEVCRTAIGSDALARCLELGKANQALLESLCVEQRDAL